MCCYVDYEYFPDGRVILTGFCYYKTRPDHVVKVNWSLSNENLIIPYVTVRNSSSSWELQIDGLPMEYNTSIIRCTVSIANRSICERQWRMLARGNYCYTYIYNICIIKVVTL